MDVMDVIEDRTPGILIPHAKLQQLTYPMCKDH